MRTNLPVTGVELVLADDALIVSKTDLKGQITYINADFLKYSGFVEAELMGQPHNLVRHPDMPPAAFQDLWDTVKAGKPWMGVVKNRCKNGDHYWVEATATPLREGGNVVGYMSVRRKPTRAVVEAAEALYRQVREGKASLENKVSFWERLPVGRKLSVAVSVAVAAVVGLSAVVIGYRTHDLLEQKGVDALHEQVRAAYAMVDQASLQYKKDIVRLGDVFASGFTEMFSVSKGAGLAELRLGGKTLNDQFAEVDRFTARSGAVATFFVKDGDDFYRVSTSVKKADGSRAVGTPLGKAHPAYAKLMAGERFSGLANLFGKDFVTDYKPIKDSGGQVIGATFVGVDATDEMAALKSKLRSVKVGDTGYMYVLNSKPGDKYGTLIVHPAKEGQNIIDAKDASGREFIKDIMEAKSGVAVRYPWLNAEKGETTPRMKIVVTEKFDEWGWAISGGTYIDEFEKETRVVFWLLGSSLLVAVLVLAGVVSVVMRRNITEPLQQVNSAFDRIIQGDFSSQLAVNRHDEIGDMFRSLITMQTQTGFNIIETKRASDEMARIKIGLYSSTAAVTISDVNGLLIHATPAADVMFTAAFGTTATDLIGKKLTETVLTDPKVQADMADAVLRGHEMDVVVGDSHLRLAARPIRLASGETLGRVTTWQDRTNEVMVEKEVESIVYAAAQGDFSRRLALEGKTGFFLSLANGLNTLLETSATGLEEVADVLGSLAQGDLSRQVGGDYQGTFGQLKDDTNLTINQLKNIIQSIQESSEAINTAAKEIAAGNTDLSSRTEEQASSLEETASSMEQLSGTVKQNAANASDAHRVAEVSRQSVEDGGVVFSQLVETMKDIHTSSSKITDIIGVIDGIAFQTNILALNAAVEAARAGEQGRGFAVVATEVRSLAQRSAAAAKEIKTLIEASSSKVAEGTHLVSDASKAMESVQNSIVRVARLIGDIASASVEQSSGIGQVSLAISQMDEVTQQNAALVEEAAAAAESLEDQAQTLTEAVSVFRLEAGGNGGNSGGQGGRVSASKPAVSSHRPTASRAQTAARTSTAARSSSKAAPSVSDEGDEWAEF